MATKKRVYSTKEVLSILQKEDNGSDVESIEDLGLDSDAFFEEDSEDDNSSNDEENICEGKNGYQWKKISENDRRVGRMPVENIFRRKAGIRNSSKVRIGSPLDAWKLLFTDRMMIKIVNCTNEKAKQADVNLDLTREELLRFFGLLYMRGALCMRKTPIQFIWSNKYGSDFFKNTMSRNRFNLIKKLLRFDSQTERSRNKDDSFIHIREIFESFTTNSMVHFVPYEHITIDEQLVPMKNRCKIIQYMPNKPDKFGIKLWIAACNYTKYCFNQAPYLGAQEKVSRDGKALGEYVVLKLAEPLFNFGYNITVDNFFTTVNLADELLRNKTTLVGTVRLNNRFLNERQKEKSPLYTTDFFTDESEKKILVSYQSKKNKKVILLSTQHKRAKILKGEKRKPEIVDYYNKTKAGVDQIDGMVKNYSVKSSTRRWPLAIFYDLLDKCGLNSYILFKEAMDIKISRKDFLLQLAEEMVEEMKKEEKVNQEKRKNLKRTLTCSTKKCRNKSKEACQKCEKIFCGTHSNVIKKVICYNCETN